MRSALSCAAFSGAGGAGGAGDPECGDGVLVAVGLVGFPKAEEGEVWSARVALRWET